MGYKPVLNFIGFLKEEMIICWISGCIKKQLILDLKIFWFDAWINRILTSFHGKRNRHLTALLGAWETNSLANVIARVLDPNIWNFKTSVNVSGAWWQWPVIAANPLYACTNWTFITTLEDYFATYTCTNEERDKQKDISKFFEKSILFLCPNDIVSRVFFPLLHAECRSKLVESISFFLYLYVSWYNIFFLMIFNTR